MCLIELFLKAARSMTFKLLGKLIEVICAPRNASTPIEVTFESAGKLIFVITWL